MLLKGLRCRLFALLTGLLLTVMGLVAVAAPVQAGERNLVIFGDSDIADASFLEHFQVKLSASRITPSAGGCATSDRSYAAQAAQQLDIEAQDYSCVGATSFTPSAATFDAQVDRALVEGTLNPATERVLVSISFNDIYRNMNFSPAEIQARFIDTMIPQISRIKAAAPHARIQTIGYASIADGDFLCLVHIGGNLHDRTYLPIIGSWEQLVQDMQRDLAQLTSTEFIDLKAATADNDTCAPDNHRMWGGLVDVAAGPGKLPIHLNARGHEYVAGVIAAR
ncbi:GDSL-type esterase/lipase family protein [Corynebacterium sp. A21]|uniref:GDSL-type esterase/lipase family protein n=1 Tax=Corynebacterium sp. A21 TaxID=3457318 RepID=UPI003FD55641